MEVHTVTVLIQLVTTGPDRSVSAATEVISVAFCTEFNGNEVKFSQSLLSAD